METQFNRSLHPDKLTPAIISEIERATQVSIQHLQFLIRYY